MPAFVAGAVAVDSVRERERQAGLRALRETVRSTALLVDSQIERSLGELNALGQSPLLQSGDFKAIYEEAKLSDRPPDVWTLMLDETGQQVVNTGAPYGTPAPPPAAAARVAKVLATREPLVSDVLVGPLTGRLVTTVYVPAGPTPQGRYVLGQVFSVEHWRRTALQPQSHADWIVGVIDRNGRFVARSHKTAELLGQPARPELVAAAAATSDGLVRHRTLEGVDVYDAFTHSALTGWTIAVAAPAKTIDSSATLAAAWLGAGFLLALGVAALAASLLGRTMVDTMTQLAHAARALGEGRAVVAAPSRLAEANELNAALTEAAALLAAERSARELAQQERERLLNNEREARAAAQLENLAKDRFVAMLGHELRNPLAAISGATQALKRKPQDTRIAEKYVPMLERQSAYLGHIVNDLLDVGRMVSGKLVVHRKPIDLAVFVSTSVESLQASQRSASYRLTVAARTVWVDGDAPRLEQVVTNLVTNAQKFSAPGSEIVIEVAPVGRQAILKVSDSGLGIAPDMLSKIFEPFVQVPVQVGEVNQGLGIGLALVRQIVELHDGSIVATSGGLGKGATFSATLPAITPARVEGRAAAKTFERHRVLLVEDNADAREGTADTLRSLGYDVVEAADGDEAAASLRTTTPDVIVMDIGLPGKSGLELAVQWKSDRALQAIPLIALSGLGQERDRKLALAAGFCSYLVKPSSPEAIACAIDEAIGTASIATKP